MNVYIPLYYLIVSRLKRKIEIVSWLILYLIPIFIVSIYFYGMDFHYWSMILFGYVIFFTFYEVGYIENDIKTVLKEKSPNHRVTGALYDYIHNNYTRVVLVKYITGFIFTIGLYFYSKFLGVDLAPFIFGIIVTRVLFLLHNKVRNNYNIITFFLLSSAKYTSLLYLSLMPLFFENYNVELLILLFPLLRTIEHATKDKYNNERLKKMVGSLDSFRVIYYAVLLLGLMMAKPQNHVYVIMAGYYFMFRLFVFLLVLSFNDKFKR